MKKFLQEFKEFALKGSVVDLAVGVIIGAAFQAIVNSFIDNMISPILGCFTAGGLNGLTIPIWKANIYIGAFLTDVINFIIMAFVVFLIVKAINKIKSLKKTETEALTKVCPYCQSEIDVKAIRCPHCTSELDR